MKQNNQWTNDAKKFLNPIITSCGYVWIIHNLEVSICHIQIDILKSLQLVIDSTFTFDKVTSFQWWTNHKHNHVVRINVSVWPILRLLKLKQKTKILYKTSYSMWRQRELYLIKMGGSRAALIFFPFTWRICIGFMNLDWPSKDSKIQIKKEMKIGKN